MVICALYLVEYLLCLGTIRGLLDGVFSYEERAKKLYFYIAVAAGLVLTALSVLLCSPENGDSLAEVLLVVGTTCFAYLRYKPHKKGTFLWIGLMLCSLVDLLEYRIVSLFPEITRIRCQMVYCALYALACLIIWLWAHFWGDHMIMDFPERIPSYIYAVVFVANYSAYYTMTLKHNTASSAVLADVMHFVSAGLSAVCIGFMIYHYVILANLRKEDEQVHALELERYEEMIQNNQDVRAFRHDYKNNLFALDTFIESGRMEEAKEYIRSLTETLERTKGRYVTGNILADAIISDKTAKAEEAGVHLDFDGAIPSAGISNRDLCAILSNALDNAIEACRPQAPCEIRVRSAVKRSGMVFTVSNPVTERVNIRNGVVQTSKKDKQNHGFGIANIRKAAKNYDGYVELSSDANTFTIEVGLMLKGVSAELQKT